MITLERLDTFLASQARPYTVYLLGTCVGICCFYPATAQEALGIAAVVITGNIGARTYEKVTGKTGKAPLGDAPPTPPAGAPG